MHIRRYWTEIFRQNVMYSLPQAYRSRTHTQTHWRMHARHLNVFGCDRHSIAERLSTFVTRVNEAREYPKQAHSLSGGLSVASTNSKKCIHESFGTYMQTQQKQIGVESWSHHVSLRTASSLFLRFFCVSSFGIYAWDCNKIPIKRLPCGRPKFRRSKN